MKDFLMVREIEWIKDFFDTELKGLNGAIGKGLTRICKKNNFEIVPVVLKDENNEDFKVNSYPIKAINILKMNIEENKSLIFKFRKDKSSCVFMPPPMQDELDRINLKMYPPTKDYFDELEERSFINEIERAALAGVPYSFGRSRGMFARRKELPIFFLHYKEKEFKEIISELVKSKKICVCKYKKLRIKFLDVPEGNFSKNRGVLKWKK